MMVTINGKQHAIPNTMTVSGLLETMGYSGNFVAVAINHSCVPRSQFGDTTVQEHDDIEVLAPMAGG